MPDAQMITQEEVMFFDTDCGGVVHNLAYLRMIETCRTKLGGKMGMNLREMGENMQFAVVVRTEADYRSPAMLGDEIEVRGWLEEWGRVRFWCGFEMVRPSDGKRLVTCRQQLAMVKMPEGKVMRLGEEPQLEAFSS